MQVERYAQPEEPWRDWDRLSVILNNVPLSWGTRDVHQLLLEHNVSPVRIDMSGGENHRPGSAKLIFRPPPRNAMWWISRGFTLLNSGRKVHIRCRAEREPDHHAIERQHGRIEELALTGNYLAIGFLKDTDTMLAKRTIKAVTQVFPPRLVVNLRRQQIDIHFGLRLGGKAGQNGHSFLFRIPFTELHSIAESRDSYGTHLTIPFETPPLAFRKVLNVLETHHDKIDQWDERQTWYRQTSIESDPKVAAGRRAQLRNDDIFIDVGRWLCYRFVCSPESEPFVQQLRVVLAKHNISIHQRSVQCTNAKDRSQWDWLDSSFNSGAEAATSSFDLFNSTTVHLPFTVQYQLEACISQGCLHESNITTAWLEQLLAQDKGLYKDAHDPKYPRATKLLERVLESKQRFYDPMQILQFGQQVSLVQKHIPSYCTLVRSATVTPTTIYFNSPSVDTSNRVIRKFREHEDRFLRVKFRDESYKGTIMTFDDDTNDELFTRVNRVLKNGIVVGDRHYEFLAYGNSQFREHGAYFFAPTSTVTTETMRRWMGDFENIKTVAKCASRIGQCFTTTRAMANSVKTERIPDIERNGYCFTDGVGKISEFSLQMSAKDMKLPNCPSVIQFRLGGSKGVLACDPNLKGQVIQIRPSQEKFPAPYNGLEICRVSQFATAYLNQQIVLVLSALGVQDEVFLVMLRQMLSKLETAMSDESVAMDMLMSNIDLYQSTVALVDMIKDGFMAAQDPFFVTNLRLWRAWSMKYLKEKAKILVENGAFVIGNIDELGILKGHSDLSPASDTIHDVAMLPEIFLQVEDMKHKGTWKVVEGVCLLARNPSLHPGDLRVVNAVNVRELHHFRDCVVLPSRGDRDVAGMCSGGDLDGDDYLVIWEPNLIPYEWNHAPMDYSAPTPVVSKGPVTVDDMTAFFVTHMKYDNLGRIATAHRYWADRMEEGVKHDNCLELAALHSRAVDYAKTGVAAEMPKHLKVSRWPHWAEKEKNRSYESKKILGQMYDEVVRVSFEPAWDIPFDDRILKAYELDSRILALAREVKCEYDEAIRRLMTQHAVKTEFEIWTTFIMEHNYESRDFKIAEELGETMAGLRKQFQDACYETAGTTAMERDETKMKLFVAAMYTVTAQEVAQANDECNSRHLAAGRWVPDRERTSEAMPLMSFPWLFRRELGDIAVGRSRPQSTYAPIVPTASLTPLKTTSPSISTSPDGGVQILDSLPLVEVKEPNRKDSMELLFSDTPAQTSQQVALDGHRSNSVQASKLSLLPMQDLDRGFLDDKVLENVLSECRAFEHSDKDSLDEGTTELNTLPAGPSGQYENNPFAPLKVFDKGVNVTEGNEDAEDEEGSEIEVSQLAML